MVMMVEHAISVRTHAVNLLESLRHVVDLVAVLVLVSVSAIV